jgi:CO dehydrogenase/acetyl-CoA synthase beta subunit
MKQVNGNGTFQKISAEELANYNDALTKLANLSSSIEQSFKNSYGILEKIKNLAAIDRENVAEITAMANSLTTAAKSLSDEKTVIGLKHLESIVSKRKE